VLRGRFYNCGQTCTAVKRLYLFEGIAEKFLGLLERRIRSLRVGNGLLDGIDMGPLNNESQRDYVAELVRGVEERGEGKILTGGKVPTGEGYSEGYFFEPTLVSEVSPDSRLLNEEVFGPVLPVVRVQTLDEAIEEANRTKYGLGASVWTKNIDRVRQAYEQLEAGTVWVNQHLKVAPELPFGGTKESGFGRENGPSALSDYLVSKTVMIRT